MFTRHLCLVKQVYVTHVAGWLFGVNKIQHSPGDLEMGLWGGYRENVSVRHVLNRPIICVWLNLLPSFGISPGWTILSFYKITSFVPWYRNDSFVATYFVTKRKNCNLRTSVESVNLSNHNIISRKCRWI